MAGGHFCAAQRIVVEILFAGGKKIGTDSLVPAGGGNAPKIL
jgi:hypothetical protein